MDQDEEQRRRDAIGRYHRGERISSICRTLNRPRSWFYKWLGRSRTKEQHWYADRSRKPLQPARSYEQSTYELILRTRDALIAEGSFYGPAAIGWELRDCGVESVPSLATIKRIVQTNPVAAQAAPHKTRPYPAPMVTGPGSVHQGDFVGPRYINGLRFYSLNMVDLATSRVAVPPVARRATEPVIGSFWQAWWRLGMPRLLQLDNELVFFGNQRYPRALGQFARLCLHYGIELLFIPIREPWRNGVIEKFNDHWNRRFYRTTREVRTFDQLSDCALRFESSHNSRWRYSKLRGRTPDAALESFGTELRWPPRIQPPPLPLPRPKSGLIHFIRFIRGNRQLPIFGQRFELPPEALYQYVQATLDLARSALDVRLHGSLIESIPYRPK